jgi:threonine/homoserine/homoserine lactone efflux protein
VKNSNGSLIAGIALQFINPKLMLFSFTTMSSFILPWYTSIPVLICFVVLLTIIGFASTVCWAVSGSIFSKIFNEHKRILGIILALLLVYCAASLFL